MVLFITANKEESVLYPTHVDNALQRLEILAEPEPAMPNPKKRKVAAGSDKSLQEEKSERISLFKWTFLFDIEGIQGVDLLKNLLLGHNGEIELPVQMWIIKNQEDSITMKIADNHKVELLVISCISKECAAILPELTAALRIAHAKRPGKSGLRCAGDFDVQLALKLGGDLRRPFSAQLELKVDKEAQNQWSHDSLAYADYWQVEMGTAFPHGKADEPLFHYRHKLYPQRVMPRAFYEAATVPEKDHVPPAIQPAKITCQMLPFQTRTVRWMLRREGFDVQDGCDDVVDFRDPSEIPPAFFKNVSAEGKICYVSHLLGVISTNLDPLREEFASYRGGILAEEMGLGKSVEIIALVCLNKRSDFDQELIFDEYTEQKVKPSSATLIIAPSTILHQWQKEIATHAPHLRVHHYVGMHKSRGKNRPTVDGLLGYDIVLTTYDVLSKEIHYATPPPDRSVRRRAGPVHKPPRSPLVDISWWRVCLDEAQMIESGVSNAANVARLIPRVNAWCVTGTPVGKAITDLYGLLIFLRYEPLCRDKKVWTKLLAYHPQTFKAIFNRLSLRHTKSDVRDEIYLPPQKRFVITVPFSHVEEENYKFFFEQMIEECEITAEGCKALDEGHGRRTAVISKMRSWLVRLRQICSHAQVGRGNRRLGAEELRTVEDVLEQMIEQHLTQLRSDERALFFGMLKRGQVLEHYEQLDDALEIYLDVNRQLQAVVLEARQRVLEEEKLLNSEESTETPGKENGDTNNSNDGAEGNNTTGDGNGMVKNGGDGKEKGQVVDENEEVVTGENNDYEPEEQLEDQEWWYEDITKLLLAKRALRDILEIEHVSQFFLGSIHFQLKCREEEANPKSNKIAEYAKKEAEYYEAAKVVRKELLTQTEGRAQRYIDNCKRKAQNQSFADIPEMVFIEIRGGIETQTISEELSNLQDELNAQANLLDEWREKMIQVLISPLIDQDDDATGEEYEQSVHKQAEGFAYLEALKAVVADRDFALTGQRNPLIEQDIQRAMERDEAHTDLLKNLLIQRNSVKPEPRHAMRVLLTRLRTIISTLRLESNAGNHRAEMEKKLAEDLFQNAQKLYNAQAKVDAKLRKELDLYRTTINARVEFYRQLQTLSDTVVPFNPEKERDVTLETTLKWKQEQEVAAVKIADARAKERYLSHLKTSNEEEGRTCIICQCTFELGTFTVCGHQYCAECMSAWYKQHRSCPMCKRQLKAPDMYHITYSQQPMNIQEEQHSSAPTTVSDAVHAIYSDMQASMLKQIKQKSLANSFGSKIDMICKHLLWLNGNEVEAKSVIFSQWSDVLFVFEQAFNANGIKFATMEKNGVDRFKNDPDVKCFLLHAKSQSAGLTLVNATNVFICEPLLNAGLELQAISRVHRIGQTKHTTVWLYVVSGTVEQSVLDLSTKRRLALAGVEASSSDNPIPVITETRLDELNSEELKQEGALVERTVGGGEMVGDADLLECLVGSARDKLSSRAAGEEVRRSLMAGAAENRIASANAGGRLGEQEMALGQAGPSRRQSRRSGMGQQALD